MTRRALALEVAGWTGTALLLGGFLLNTLGSLPSRGLTYLLLNLLGSAGVGVNAWSRRAWSFTVLVAGLENRVDADQHERRRDDALAEFRGEITHGVGLRSTEKTSRPFSLIRCIASWLFMIMPPKTL